MKPRSQVKYKWLMNKRLARIIAHLMGDGCISKYVRYHNKEPFLLSQFKTDFKGMFGDVHFTEGLSNSGTAFVSIQNKKIRQLLLRIHKDYRSGNIELPKPILACGKPIKREFLRAFYDDEGSASMKFCQTTKEIKCVVQLVSKSRKMMTQIKKILERELGIMCNKIIKSVKLMGSKSFTVWVLAITGKENLIRFTEKINFYHPRKREKLRLIETYYRIRKRHRRNVYIFSLFYNFVSGHRGLETPKPISNLEHMWQKPHLQES